MHLHFLQLSCGVWSSSEFKLLGASMHNDIGRNFSPEVISHACNVLLIFVSSAEKINIRI